MATSEGYRLSPQQRHVWQLQQGHPGLPYRTQCAVLVEGEIDVAAFRAAVERTVARYEILRTTFRHFPGLLVPLQVIANACITWGPALDLRSLSADEQATRFEALWNEAQEVQWNLEQGPVVWAALATLEAHKHVVVISVPALCADRVSVRNLVREIGHACGGAQEEAADEPMQYADLAEWQNDLLEGEDAEAGRDFWRKQAIARFLDLRLPFEKPSEATLTWQPSALSLTFDAQTVIGLAAWAKQRNTSPSALLLACWYTVLWRLTQQSPIVISTRSDGRSFQELQEALGPFEKYLPILCYLAANDRVADVVDRVQALVLEATNWQDSFAWEQVTESGADQPAPVFAPFCFDYDEGNHASTAGNSTFTIYQEYGCTDRFNLKLSCTYSNDSLSAALHYDPARFLPEDVQRLAEHIAALVSHVVREPDVTLDRAEILSTAQKQRLLVEFNATFTEAPAAECVHHLFEQQVRRTPEAVAVTWADRHLTYAELDHRSAQLASYLRTMGVGPDVLVGIYVEPSLELLVGILGVLKAGGAYLPIDSSLPAARIEFMLNDAQVPVLLTQSHMRASLPQHSAAVVALDTDWETIAKEHESAPHTSVDPANLAYVIYTSGSTGTPKGVMISHAGLINYLRWCTQAYAVGEGLGAPVHSSVSFDLTITALFPPLLTGRSTAILSRASGVEALLATLRGGNRWSLVKITPAHLELLSQLLTREEAAGCANALVIGGEQLLGESLAFWRTNAPNVRLINEYGPTETVVGCCVYELPAGQAGVGPVPIGRPIANTKLYLLDHYLQPVPIGVPGELYIGGAGVARGYLDRPALTAERFVPSPFSDQPGTRLYRTGDWARFRSDGEIEFLGRIDDQVKIRGYRVELGEIEAVLAQHHAVGEVVVLPHEYQTGDVRLVAYVVPNSRQALPVRQLLRWEREGVLANRQLYDLPNGMVVVSHNKNETDYLYREIWEQQEYLKHGIELPAGACIFDVGANVGLFTLHAGHRSPQAIIYAFEPIPAVFDALKLNTSLYGHNTKLFNCGLGSAAGSATFQYYPNLSMMSSRFADLQDDIATVEAFETNQNRRSTSDAVADAGLLGDVVKERLVSEQVTCPIRTISEVIREHNVERIDLLKIDVERAELDVIAGINDDDWHKIDQIVVEVHDIDRRVEQVVTMLERHGFVVTVEQAASLAHTNIYDVYALRSGRQHVRDVESKRDGSLVPVWANRNRLIEDIRATLNDKLPEYMVPSAFILLDTLPLTTNGKVDRRALPAVEHINPGSTTAYVAPSTPAEKVLAGIWTEVLRRKQVGVHDNFFAIGGDSILSIQVIARARRAGLQITPNQMFRHQTIAELAAVAGTGTPVEAEQGLVVGPVPLLPIQHWFFEHSLPDPHHWVQSVSLPAGQTLDAALLKQVVQRLVAHHDALRLRFTRDEVDWRQSNAGIDENLPYTTIDLSALVDAEQDQAVEAARVELEASLNVEHGPTIRVALIHRGSAHPALLLIVIHRLLIDGVSWRIVLEDLQHVYGQLSRGIEPQLPAKTTPYKRWAERMVQFSQTDAVRQTLDYWIEAARAVAPLSIENPDLQAEAGAPIGGSLTVMLEASATRALLQDVPSAYRTQINDVLLAALLLAYHDWAGKQELVVDLEGHGRDPIFDDIDLSRTVGWFTTVFPARLRLDQGSDDGAALKAVKEQLRQIPQRGMSYGLLRYLSEDADIRARFRGLPRPAINFNYLGQFDPQSSEQSLFDPAAAENSTIRTPGSRQTHAIEIGGAVVDGALHLHWLYDERIVQRATVEDLAGRCIEALRRLIDHCQPSAAGGYTPSDFHQAAITQTELDTLLERISAIAGQPATPRADLIETIYPLSPMQQGMLFYGLYAPKSEVYFEQMSCLIRRPLDSTAFERAWSEVIERHPILRTSFHWEGLSQPIQVVHRQVPLPLTLLDWRDGGEHTARLAQYLQEDRQQGFDFQRAPLMRVSLIAVDGDAHYLVWSHHHLLLDGWSVAIILNEVFACYEARSQNQAISLERSRPYGEYIEWLQRQDLTRAETFWRDTLRGFHAPTPLAVDRFSGTLALEEEYADESITFSAETTAALQALARQNELTLNTLVRGAWILLLSRYSGEEDVVIGATFSGRTPVLPGVDTMVGMFINTLPIRARVSPEAELVPWLRQLQAQQFELHQYEWTPLVQIQQWSDVAPGHPLFESIVVFENYPVDEALQALPGSIEIADIRFMGARTNYPITVLVSPALELSLRVTYDRRRFDEATIRPMLAHLQILLEGMVAAPEQRLAALPLLTSVERQQLLVDWNRTAAPYPGEMGLHQLFEAQAARTPDKQAIVADGRSLTYGELNRQANILAHHLRKLGVGPEACVGVWMDRTPEMVVGLLGILKSGGAYVPLDPSYPRARVAMVLEDAQVQILLTRQRLVELLPERAAITVLLDDGWADELDQTINNPAVDRSPDSLAYVIYTSGSTGRPKGVAITHRSAMALIGWSATVWTPEELAGVLASTSISFDLSVFELFVPLSLGGTVLLIETALHLPLFAAANDVTLINTVPSAITELLRAGAIPASVLGVNLAGEPLQRQLVRQMYERNSALRIFNLYGPSEDTTYSTAALVDGAGHDMPPIGRPIANTSAYVLDATMQPVPVGVPGELYLGGAGLARCYLGQPGLTAGAFVPNPFGSLPGERLYRTGDQARFRRDGTLEFLGRIDHQVKIRGYRIELGEIEAVLAECPGVAATAVSVREDVPGDKRIVAYVVEQSTQQTGRNGATLTIEGLRSFVQERLPEYMTPSTWVMLDALPLTPSGKIDRRALPAPERLRPELEAMYVAPRTHIERQIATIWQDVLQIEQVGVHDNFFDLGGHSLLMVRVHSKLREALGHDLQLFELFVHPTITDLAKHLREETVEQSWERGVERAEVRRQSLRRQRAGRQQRTGIEEQGDIDE